jgi:hypothetical protein
VEPPQPHPGPALLNYYWKGQQLHPRVLSGCPFASLPALLLGDRYLLCRRERAALAGGGDGGGAGAVVVLDTEELAQWGELKEGAMASGCGGGLSEAGQCCYAWAGLVSSLGASG